MKISVLIFCLLCVCNLAFAGSVNSKAGTTGADFLKIPQDTHTQALGGMNFTDARLASTIFNNPAAMSALDKPSAYFGMSKWLSKTTYNSFAFVLPVYKTKKYVQVKSPVQKKHRKTLDAPKTNKIARSDSGEIESSSAFGIGVVYFDAGSMRQTELDQYGHVEELSNEIKANDLCVTAGYSKMLKFCSLGVNAKYISRKLADKQASAYAADFGLYKSMPGFHKSALWLFGVTLQNLGTKLDFISETSYKDKLPLQFGCGAGIQYEKLFFGVNCAKPIDNDIKMNAWFSCDLKGGLNLAFGYKLMGIDKDAIDGSLTGFSMGFGIPIRKINGEIGYSYVPYNKLSNTHHISFAVKFGEIDYDYEDD